MSDELLAPYSWLLSLLRFAMSHFHLSFPCFYLFLGFASLWRLIWFLIPFSRSRWRGLDIYIKKTGTPMTLIWKPLTSKDQAMSKTGEHISSCRHISRAVHGKVLTSVHENSRSVRLTRPFCTPVASPGSCWFVDVVVFRPEQFCKNPCSLLMALCNGAPVLLLNIILFSISTIHNLHTVASNID